ncbi:radical SAM protein [candidate division KSB1 bacterium]|nr:radical SAM protein [candidate division KSB1 bacterium]
METDNLLRQIFSIPLDENKYLIYAPLKGIAFIGNVSLVNSIFEQCRSSGALWKTENLDFLHQLNFFLPEPFPVDEYKQSGTQYDAVILFLTNQCNLRCSYCYASSGEYPRKTMSWEIARDAIDYVMESVRLHNAPVMTLGFHGGGEPTLNWNILTRSVDYARCLADKNRVPLQVSGSFNGYWSRKILKYILNNFTELSLSFDGLPEVQNLQRPAMGNKESYPRVAETLHALDGADFPYGIRMTITNDTVDRLAESVAFICDNFHPQKIQVEPAFAEGRAIENHSLIKDIRVFIDQFMRAYSIAEKQKVTLFYSGARLNALTTRFCLAACRAFVVTTEGDVTTCFETYGREHPAGPRFFVGTYTGNGGFEINTEKRQKHFSRTVDEIPFCQNCYCKWHCAGDCEIKTTAASGDGFQPSRCLINQELIKYLILDKIKQNGGLLWVNHHQ